MKHKVNYLLIKTLIAGIILVAITSLLIVFLSKSYCQVTVTPRSAKVVIDGKELKTTSKGVYSRNLTPGKHEIDIFLDGYVGQAKAYNFSRGIKKKINLNLKEMPKPSAVAKKGRYLFASGNDYYFLANGGKTLYRGTKKEGDQYDVAPITDAKLANIKEIVWSPDQQLALFRKSDGKITLFDFKKYDFVNQSETPWGENIGSVAWAPDNSEIAYFYETNDERTMIFSDLLNGARERVVNFDNFEISNPTLRWSPDSQSLAVIPKNKDRDQNKVYLFNSASRSLRELSKNGGYADAVFLDSDTLIGIKDDGSAFLINKDDGAEKDLDIKTMSENIQVTKNSAYILTAKNSLLKIDHSGEKNGLMIEKLSDKIADLSAVLNDDKIIIYQTSDGIFSLTL